MPTSPDSPRPVQTGRYRYTKWRWRILVGAFDFVGSILCRVWRTAHPVHPPGEPRRILILQLDHMGDAVLTSPLITRLREAYPSAQIDVLASPSNREIFASNPDLDHVRIASRNWFERKPGRWALGSAVVELGRSLRGSGYDLGIDVRGDILSVLVLILAGIPRRLGWTMGGGGFLLTDVADWIPGRHEVRSRLALLDRLGVDTSGPNRVIVHASDADRVTVARRLRDAWPSRSTRHRSVATRGRLTQAIGAGVGLKTARSVAVGADWDEPDWLHAGRFGEDAPLLAVHLGAGTAAKRWPARHWQELIGRFLNEGWRVIMVGGPDDVATATTVPPQPGLRDWTGQLAVTETAALLERADFFIGTDSGPAHIAASAGIPSVVLFSGTNKPAQWRPWSRRTLVLRNRVACRPCHQKICPLADHPCMAGIRPERVFRAAKRWWARLHRSESPHVAIGR
jgi:ADP-heptose:LPS heptosyltransferase